MPSRTGRLRSGVTINAINEQMTEAQFQRMVIAAAKQLGYRVYHTWVSIKSEPGWPDLAMWRGKRFLLAELKGPKGKLTAAQEQTIKELREAGLEVYVWYPKDYDTALNILLKD